MKKNVSSILIEVLEWLVMIVPMGGYSAYIYNETLQYTMSPTSKGTFWSLIGLSILAAILFRVFKQKYKDYRFGYVKQKTELETEENNIAKINAVARKEKVIENLEFVIMLIPIAIIITVLKAFQSAIDQLIVLLEIILMSIAGKIVLHTIHIETEKQAMLKKADKGGE